MPIFIPDEEFERCSHDVSLIAEKADSYIKDLQRQIETIKAQADAASITAEQTCSLLEQKYISLSSDFEKLESQNAQLNASIEQGLSELAGAQSEKHRIHLEAIGKDGEIERLSTEVSELHKSKRQLLDLVEQKDTEIREKNATVKSYYEKIVSLTDDAALKQAHLRDREAELARCNASRARLLQEKELIEKHNVWLNEELTTKVADLIEVRKKHNEAEADISTKLAHVERQYNDCSSSLKWNKERVKELEAKVTSLQEELCSTKDAAAENEERFSSEIAIVTKLVELYKESSEEWSKKAGELEGVIKALETHLTQVENDYKEKLQKETTARQLHEKEAADLKEKLEKCEAELENYRKTNELSILPISSFTEERWAYRSDSDDVHDNDRMVVPKIPVGVSGTALAASLLRDGWSLAKMYEKYQEAVDALRHESMGRKQSQAILERVLYEIEQKAEVILDERAEHERMEEAYALMNQKLQQSTAEQGKLEGMIQNLKADLRRSEREHDMAQKEISDLQKQVTFLLKECRDIQLRCGSATDVYTDESATTFDVDVKDVSGIERVISERLLTFRDIKELVEQNVKLRSLVRSLSDQNENRDTELREMFEMELRKQTDEAASKVAVVLGRSEEQGRMIESLHSSVAMYKRLYEEELKTRASHPSYSKEVPDSGRKDIMLLLEDTQDASKKAQEQAVERAKNLEEELDKARKENVSLRLERDKLSMESNFSRERLDSYMKEFEHQRDEMNTVLARNVEFSQLIVDYQRKVRESSDSLQVAEELSRKLTMEVSLLKQEKEMLLNSEKRACNEVRSLSERVHRLQASLDTIHSAEEVRDEARIMEKKKQEEHLKQVEREWAQLKKELQEERDNVRTLSLDRGHTIQNAMRQVEELGKQLADALRDVSSAESRAAVAEARCSDLEAKFKASQHELDDDGCGPSTSLTSEVELDLPKVKEELERLKKEAQANENHMLQYKSIAQVNEVAVKEIAAAHERFKTEADKMKKSLEAEIVSLRGRISELESDSISKYKEAASAVSDKEEAINSALAEISGLKEENSVKTSQFMVMEVQISSLKEELEKEHQQWRTAKGNYERQVILQSETLQELTKTSQALSVLQEEVSQLRKLSDSQMSENNTLKEKLASETSVLGMLKDEAERKYNEVNEQNKILHARLEALHIKMAEREQHTAGASASSDPDSKGDSDMQYVVDYLRRSKEIAETEISLLKQEKLRLQAQLESALKASETTQAQLHTERANSRAILFSDEDFKSLQLQVREMNLLRESNLQLREENKHNFEECQKLRELAQKANIEMEHLEAMLTEKKLEVDSCRKEIEMQKKEKGNLEKRIDELLGVCKSINLEDYNRMKDDYQQMQEKLRAIEADLDKNRQLVSEKQDSITSLEQELANKRVELIEKESRMKECLQTEATLKLDMEKQRKVAAQVKKKFEALTKEKEELSKEKQTLLKQLEDSRQGKRLFGDTSSEQSMKEKEREKDTRIQILERTLEREREELRKEREEHRKEKDEHRNEKSKRLRNQKAVEELLKKANQEKTKLVNELEKYKQARENLPESNVPEVSQAPDDLLDNQSASYLQAMENLVEGVNSFYSDEPGAMDTSSTAALQAPVQTLPIQHSTGTTVAASQTLDSRERKSNVPKPHSESRKLPRKLVRTRLVSSRGPSGDSEMSEVDASSNAEGKRDLTLPSSQTPVRKRLASLSGSELREESHITSSIQVPPLSKKSRSESRQEGSEGQVSLPTQNLEASSTLEESFDAAGDQPHAANELASIPEKDEDSKESLLDDKPTRETQSNNELMDTPEEEIDNLKETEDGLRDGLKDGEEQDPQHATVETLTTVETESDREEGELPADETEEQDADELINVESGELQREFPSTSDVPSPAADEELDSTAGELIETASTAVTANEKNDTGEAVEEMAEDSEFEKSPKAAFGTVGSSSPTHQPDLTVSDQRNLDSAPITEEEEGPSVKTTTINLTERAIAKPQLRVRGLQGSVEPSATTRESSRATPPTRDVTRGRITRNLYGRGRGGRRPASDQGQG